MRNKLSLVAVGAAPSLGGAATISQPVANVNGPCMIAADPATARMEPAPIDPTWILFGQPETQAASLGKTSDGMAQVFVWQTTAATFHWYYQSDEIITILEGETFVTDASGVERRLGPGDVAIFPSGAKMTWRVPHHVRKIAIMKRNLPKIVERSLRWARQAKAWIKPGAGSGSAFSAG